MAPRDKSSRFPRPNIEACLCRSLLVILTIYKTLGEKPIICRKKILKYIWGDLFTPTKWKWTSKELQTSWLWVERGIVGKIWMLVVARRFCDDKQDKIWSTLINIGDKSLIGREPWRQQQKCWEFIGWKCKLKLYRPLLCPAEIKGKSVTDHQQDT